MGEPINRARAFSLADLPMEAVRPGQFSRSAIRGDHSIVTYNWFEPEFRSSGQHQHPFDQLSFVLTGTLRFFVGDDTYILRAPAVVHIPANVPHGAEPAPGSERVLNIDVFAPVREDYRRLTDYQDAPFATAGEISPEPKVDEESN